MQSVMCSACSACSGHRYLTRAGGQIAYDFDRYDGSERAEQPIEQAFVSGGWQIIRKHAIMLRLLVLSLLLLRWLLSLLLQSLGQICP